MIIQAKTLQALFCKQIKDTAHNMQVLILFFTFPIIAMVMTQSMGKEMGNSAFFISIFGVMHGVFTPIVATSSMMSEEKEKNTLRVLLMSNVNPMEYLISIGGFVFLCTMVTGVLFLFLGGYTPVEMVMFMGALGVGSVISIVLGLAIGSYAKNMMAANGLALPFGMIFAFLPMLAKFNDKIGQIAKFTYGHQISMFVEKMDGISWEGVLITAVNFIVLIAVFVVVFRRNRLES